MAGADSLCVAVPIRLPASPADASKGTSDNDEPAEAEAAPAPAPRSRGRPSTKGKAAASPAARSASKSRSRSRPRLGKCPAAPHRYTHTVTPTGWCGTLARWCWVVPGAARRRGGGGGGAGDGRVRGAGVGGGLAGTSAGGVTRVQHEWLRTRVPCAVCASGGARHSPRADVHPQAPPACDHVLLKTPRGR